MSVGNGLATFGLSFMQALQAKQAQQKAEQERLADKQYERNRQESADARAIALHDSQIKGNEQAYNIRQNDSDYQKTERDRLATARQGAMAAGSAYQQKDWQSLYGTAETVGNKLASSLTMKFDRDANGAYLVDEKGNIQGQRYDKDGVTPIGEKIKLTPDQAYKSLMIAIDPIKWAEGEQIAQRAVEEEKRKLVDAKDLYKFQNQIQSTEDEKKFNRETKTNRQDAATEYQRELEKLAYQAALKGNDSSSTGSSSKDPYGSVDPLAIDASFGGRLSVTESGGSYTAQNNAVGHGGKVGHFGRLQFGQSRLEDAKKAGIIPAGMTPQQFMSSPDTQQKVEQWHIADVDSYISKQKLDQYIGQKIKGQEVTLDGMRAVAHIGGKDGLRQYLTTGGKYNPNDGKTSLSDYMKTHAGNSSAAGSTAPLQLKRDQLVAATITAQIPDLVKQIKSDFTKYSDADGINISTIEGGRAQVGLERAAQKLIEMQRIPKSKVSSRTKLFNEAAAEIEGMLPKFMTPEEKSTYRNNVLYKLLNQPSYQQMANGLGFNQQEQPAGQPKLTPRQQAAPSVPNPVPPMPQQRAAVPAPVATQQPRFNAPQAAPAPVRPTTHPNKVVQPIGQSPVMNLPVNDANVQQELLNQIGVT